MKKVIRFNLSIILMLTIFLLVGESNVEALSNSNTGASSSGISPTSVKIGNNPGKLKPGETVKLSATITPNNATNKTITWSSSDTKVATVDSNGNVKAVKDGTVKITAKTVNGKTDTVALTVKTVNDSSSGSSGSSSSSGLKISGNPKVMIVGDSKTLTASEKNVTWSSDNTNALTIDKNGKITAKGIGRAYVTATKNGKSDKVEIQVISMSFKENSIKTQVGVETTATVTVESSNTFNPILYSTIGWNPTDASSISAKQKGLSYKLNQQSKNGDYRNIYTYTASITGKDLGKGNLYFSVDDARVKIGFEVIERGEDYSLPCPTIEYAMNDNTKKIALTITPTSDIAKYDIQYSTNKKTGQNANWSSATKGKTGKNNFTYSYSDAQAKITVYGKTGNSRVCYSAPFDAYGRKNSGTKVTTNNNIKCPYTTQKVNYISGFNASKSALVKINDDNYNDAKYTGVDKVNINVTINESSMKSSNVYQYSWYNNNDKGDLYFWDLRLKGTYNNSQTFTLTTQNHETTGAVLAMDNKGNVRSCKEDNFSRSKYESVDTLGQTKVLKVNGEACSDYTTTRDILRKIYNNAPYLFASGGGSVKYIVITHDGAWTSWNGPVVSLPCDNTDSYIAPVHELAHAWDMMNNITGSKNGTTDSKTEYKNLMTKYSGSTTLGNKNLRNGSNEQDPSGCFYKYSWYYNQCYNPSLEFFVVLYTHYYFTKFHKKSEIDSLGMHPCWKWILKNGSIPGDVNSYIEKTVTSYKN